MKKFSETQDINAHITNIVYEINTENDVIVALISFDNLGFGTITAIKFKAKGFNSFGDIIKVDGKEYFYIIIQDLKIDKNESVRNLKVNLPGKEIRRLELEECQMCYADGEIAYYAGLEPKRFETEEFETFGKDKEILDAIRGIISKEARLIPQNYDFGWLCSCGRYNGNDLDTCSKCGVKKEEIFRITDASNIRDLIIKFHKNEEDRQKKEKLEKEEQEKATKKKNAIIIASSIVGLLLAFLIGNSVILSGRTVYSSEEEMKTALQGVYTAYKDSGEAYKEITISGDTAIYRWPRIRKDSDLDSPIREWNFNRGIVYTFEKIIVTNKGQLKIDDAIFEKTGNIPSIEEPKSSSEYNESGFAVLQLKAESLKRNSSFVVLTGSVKNNGTKTYKFIKVKGAFEDVNGNVIDTDWTYACGVEGLAPGESSQFKIYVDLNMDIVSCTISLLEYE